MKKLLIILILITGLTLVSSQTYVELVLDASGSMWNKLDDGRFRIEAAKDVLSKFIDGLPNGDLNVGLRIYGSQISALDDGACDDTELFVALDGLDKPTLRDTVQSAKAIGATPIALSLLAAADDFPTVADRRMIILVTDGEESCGGDLQAVAAELKARGFDIDIRIIGFDLDQRAIDSFKGIGTFENAENAEELASALETAVENIIVEEEPQAQIARETITLIAPATTAAGEAFVVGYEGDIREDDFITIVKPEAREGSYAEWADINEDGSPVSLTASIDIGTYEIRYMDRNSYAILTTTSIIVEPSTITLSVPEVVTPGQSFEINWTGPNGNKDYITLVTSDTEDGQYDEWHWTKDASPMSFTAPIIAGEYEIRYQSDREPGVFARKALTVADAEFSFFAPATVQAGTSFEVAWTGPDGPQDYITIVAVGSAPGAYKSYDYTGNGSPATLVAEIVPGEYEIRYQSDRESGIIFASTPITVTPMQISLQAPSQVNAGETFEVTWTGPDGHQDYITIVPAGSAEGTYKSYQYTSKGSSLQLTAPDEAGSYEIRYQSDRVRNIVFASIPITVK